MNETQSFGSLLRRYRAGARLTQEELAERAGVSARAITDLERGVRRFPYPDTVERLAGALNLSATQRDCLLRARRPPDASVRRQRKPLERTAMGPDSPTASPEAERSPLNRDAAPVGEIAADTGTRLRAIGSSRDERKLVTVLFGGLVDTGASTHELDPEDARDLLVSYQVRIRAVLERFGGTVEKFIGSQLVAFFGAPAAHEDDPERAVRAALAVRDWIVEQDDAVRVQIGVASGEALVTSAALVSPEAPIAIGEVVNTAAGLRLSAPLDGVLVDEQTYRRTKDSIEYPGAEAPTSKGQSTPDSAWQPIRVLAEPGIDPSRHRTPFIGRQRELAALRERLAWAALDLTPQFVTIVGVPGIGKTRLVDELRRASAADGESVLWRQGRSLPYGGGLSFWALGEIIKEEAGILESDPADEVERKLGTAVERVIDGGALGRRIAVSLGPLVGLRGPEGGLSEPRRDTFASWRRFLEGLTQERTLVLVFEDLHWAEAGLLDFIDELVERASGVRLLVVATARPELLDRRPGWAGGKVNALTLSLPPLTQSDTTRLVTAILERQVLQRDIGQALLARVGGNPLYAEQFCRILLENGRLGQLPQTIQGIIAARLDLLTDVEKRILQDAAVIGRVFWVGALEAIGGGSRPEADEILHSLARRQFVQRSRGSSVAGDIEYVFSHELLREVAYGEIPRASRGDRHRHAADWIERLGRSDDHAELLAHHYLSILQYAQSQNAETHAVVLRTIDALRAAGLRAMRLSANERAVEHFSRAISLVERLQRAEQGDRREAELQLLLGMALFAQQGFAAPRVERAYGRATELMMASAPTAEQFPLDFGLSIFHGHRGNFEHSMRLVERMTQLAASGDDTLRLQALHARWMNSLFGGQVDDAIVAADMGRAIYRSEEHHASGFLYGNHDPGVCALALAALALALRGDSRAAVSQLHEAIALAERLGHDVSLAQPLTQLPWAHQINGDPTGALREAERALALEERVAHPQFFGIARAMRGWALAHTGCDAEGVVELEQAFADELQASTIWAAMIGTLLAEIHLRQDRVRAARDLLDQVHGLAGSMPAYYYQPEVDRVEAEWLHMVGERLEARKRLLMSVKTARQHGSLALALRSALALYRTDSTDREANHKLLVDLCAHLPIDNDTDYGRDAKALIGATPS